MMSMSIWTRDVSPRWATSRAGTISQGMQAMGLVGSLWTTPMSSTRREICRMLTRLKMLSMSKTKEMTPRHKSTQLAKKLKVRMKIAMNHSTEAYRRQKSLILSVCRMPKDLVVVPVSLPRVWIATVMLVEAKKMHQHQTLSPLHQDFRDSGLRLAVTELTKASFIRIVGRITLSQQLCISKANWQEMEVEDQFPARLVARLRRKSRQPLQIWQLGHPTQG